MKYEVFIKNNDGDVINTLQGESFDTGNTGTYYSNVPKDFKFPRSFRVKNVDENEDLYGKLLELIGKTIRLESDEINGVFNISLDNDEIILNEVL